MALLIDFLEKPELTGLFNLLLFIALILALFCTGAFALVITNADHTAHSATTMQYTINFAIH